MQRGLTSAAGHRRAVVLLAALAYVPLLSTARGRLPADTKLGLSLRPWRLMVDSISSWDSSQFAGWVPHQAISYLWPSGPWYWLLTSAGVPAWVAQRLFVGTVLLGGGLGVRWYLRRHGASSGAALVAALIYQLSPYILPYASRTSLMLLPWAGLPWLMGLAEQACRPGREWWRPTAVFGLVLATVGGINLTATLMIAPGPVLAILWECRRGSVTARRAALTATRLAAIAVAVSLWWLAMLSVQGRYGADVLGYSETLQAVSTTSTSTEVLRGMGYWLAYVNGPSGATTTGALRYMTAPWLVATGSLLLIGCLVGIVTVRFRDRALAGSLLLIGVVLAVGVHPLASPSPLMSPIAADSRSTLALALRSGTRAIPLVTLALALGAAALVDAAGRTRSRTLAPLVLAGLALVNQPALFTGAIVDDGLLHDQRPPTTWAPALAALGEGSPEQRVLQLPGVESQVFRWGYTVDPPLAWLTDRPLVTRDWLPLGSPAAMDLLYALDDRLQEGTADAAAVAPVARLFGVGTIWLARDTRFEKFSSASPASVEELLRSAPDLAPTAVDNVDVKLYSVARPVPIVRTATRTVVVFGSGAGIVDAAAAGLLDGSEALLYAADLTDTEIADLVDGGATVVLTDSNRDRARQWRGSQDVWGFTESGGPGSDLLTFDPQDARLPVFAAASSGHQTIATTDDLDVRATGYGSALRLLPEYRPAMAVDGDPATAWVVGVDDSPAVGESIVLSPAPDRLSLVQRAGGSRITALRITQDDEQRDVDLHLDDTATDVPLPGSGAVTVTILRVSGPGEVGIAELLDSPHPETVRTPELRGLPTSTDRDATPFAVVLTRLRAGREDRADIEPVLRRSFETPQLAGATWRVVVRRDGLASGCASGLLAVDGVDLPLSVADADSAALARGEPVTLSPCADRPLLAGRHLLSSTPGSGVDGVTIESHANPLGTRTGAGPTPTAVVERSRDSYEVRVSDCADGCWLIDGEGWSEGWSASSGDASLGRHLPMSGGFNGWWVQPSSGTSATVTLHWAGQRPIWIALALSAVSVACLLLVLVATSFTRRWRTTTEVAGASFVLLTPAHAATTRHRVTILGAISVATTAIVVGPLWAIAALAATVVAVVLRRPVALAWCGGAVIALAGLGMVAKVTLTSQQATFGWPLQFERLHRPVLVAVVLVAVAAMASKPDRTDAHDGGSRIREAG